MGPATLILYAADVIPLEVMVFTGKYKSSLEKYDQSVEDVNSISEKGMLIYFS